MYFAKVKGKTREEFEELLNRKRAKVTQLYCINNIDKEIRTRDRSFTEIPAHLKKLTNLSEEEKRKLAIFPEFSYRFCLEASKSRAKKKNMPKILDQFKYLFVSCLKECKKRGYDLRRGWRNYYIWKEQIA